MKKDEIEKIVNESFDVKGTIAVLRDNGLNGTADEYALGAEQCISALLSRETAMLTEIDNVLNAISSADETGEPDFDSMVNAIVEVKSIIQTRKGDHA